MKRETSFFRRIARIGTASCLALLAPSAQAATSYYVSPKGTSSGICTRTDPCDLGTGTQKAQAGDYVILLDGVYSSSLNPVNSGTASAWITFQADEGALPILNGPGTTEASGVGSDVATYVRFVGIAVRNWASGFGNKWIGSTTDFSANGHWQFINCIADGNSRNGIMFSSSVGVVVRQCLIAHNGTSATSSWSSGVSFYAVQGTANDNVIEESVAFENMDNQKHTDGSGFIVDTKVTGASFINNIAFLNGGSGIRLTDAKNIVIANNTFYHNGRDTKDDGPPNPGEIYFTDGASTAGLTMLNNVGVGSGTKQDPVGWQGAWTVPTVPSNNKTAASFVDPDGTNPDFHLASGSPLMDQGTSTGAPTIDNGFDPKCIVKGKPTDIQVPSWSNYSIDYAYIKNIGGVAKCWKAGTRPAGTGIDIGAYEMNATPAPIATGGSLPPPPSAQGGTGGSAGGGGAAGGGSAGTGGAGGTAGSGGAAGGTNNSGGSGGTSGSSGNGGNGGSAGNGGVGGASGSSGNGGAAGCCGTGGTGGLAGGGSQGGGGAKGGTGGSSGGSGAGSTGSAGTNGTPVTSDGGTSGCSCEIGGPAHGNALALTALAGLLAMVWRRSRTSRRDKRAK